MKKYCKIIVVFFLYVSLLNVSDDDAIQRFDFTNHSEQLSLISINPGNPVNNAYEFGSSAGDDCFDEYIVNGLYTSEHIKSDLYYMYLTESPQKTNINIWRPPQNS